MRLNINVYEFMVSRMPFHKRQPNRIRLFWWLLKPLQWLFDNYLAWFKDTLFKANSTGQVISLEAFLNHFVSGANGCIKIIEDESGGGRWLGLREEQSVLFDKLGKRAENGAYIELAIRGEKSTILPVDFRVLAPLGANQTEIKQYVEQYKLAGKYFDIKQQ